MAPRYINGVWVDDEEQQPGEEFAGTYDSETGDYTPAIPSADDPSVSAEGFSTNEDRLPITNGVGPDPIDADPNKAATAADAKVAAAIASRTFADKNPYAGVKFLGAEQKQMEKLWEQETAARSKFNQLSLAGGKDDEVEGHVAQAILAFAPIVAGYMLGGNELGAYGAKLGVNASNSYEKTKETYAANKKRLTQAQQQMLLEDSQARQKQMDALALTAERRNAAPQEAVARARALEEAGLGPKQANVNVSLNTAQLPDVTTDKEANEAARLATEAVRVKKLAAQILAPEDLVGFIDPKTRQIDYSRLAEAGLDTLGGKILGAGNSRIQEWNSSVYNLKDILLRIRTGAAANASEAETMDRIIDGGGILASDIPTALRLIDRFIDNQRNNYRYRSQFIRENKMVGADPGDSFDRIIGLGQPLGNEGVMQPTMADNRPYNSKRARLEALRAEKANKGGL